MNINGISVRFSGDVHLPRCRRKRGVTNSFGSHEENGWRRGEMGGGGGRDGGGFDEEAQGGVKAGEGARQRGRVIDEKKKKGIECERG